MTSQDAEVRLQELHDRIGYENHLGGNDDYDDVFSLKKLGTVDLGFRIFGYVGISTASTHLEAFCELKK
jgi:hypothetical protein